MPGAAGTDREDRHRGGKAVFKEAAAPLAGGALPPKSGGVLGFRFGVLLVEAEVKVLFNAPLEAGPQKDLGHKEQGGTGVGLPGGVLVSSAVSLPGQKPPGDGFPVCCPQPEVVLGALSRGGKRGGAQGHNGRFLKQHGVLLP